MKSQIELARQFLRHSLLVGAGFAVVGALAPAIAISADSDESYTWSAELVAIDTSEMTMTVESRVESHADLRHLSDLSAGDRAILTWTGLNHGVGIRGIGPRAVGEDARLTIGAEFVAAEQDHRYISFKVPIPAADLARIQSLEPGAWVTATSPRANSDWQVAVTAIRPYHDVS